MFFFSVSRIVNILMPSSDKVTSIFIINIYNQRIKSDFKLLLKRKNII